MATRFIGRQVAARGVGALVALLLLVPVLAATPAFAHERRAVGPYTFVVGFLVEPALQGEPNGIDLRITRTDNGEPVLGAERTLKASIAFGGGTPKEFTVRSRFGVPGGYTADIIPTKAGAYIFTFSGTIDGTTINQRFESGPGRFEDVTATDKMQFPDVIPAAASIATSAKTAEDRATAAEDRAAAAEGKVGLAQALGISGIIVGLLGLGTGIAALLSARRAGTSAVVAREHVAGPSAA